MSEATIRPEDIRWRVGQISKKDPHKGSLLGYIDARTCMEALDALDHEWSAVHGDPIIVGGELIGVPCTVTVNGVTRSDVGMPSSQEPIKGAYSDALKRAAVHHGIGRELYELPRIYVKLDEYKKPVATPTYRDGRWTLPRDAGSVFYDREPDEPVAPRKRPAAQRSPEENALLTQILAIPGISDARMRLMAEAVGVPKGERANAEQLRAMLALDETPEPARAHAEAPASGGGGSSDPSTAITPEELLEQAVALTGGELVETRPDAAASGMTNEEFHAALAEGHKRADQPIEELLAEPPRPRTKEYRELPDGVARANAQKYWAERDAAEPEPDKGEQMKVALGAPVE